MALVSWLSQFALTRSLACSLSFISIFVFTVLSDGWLWIERLYTVTVCLWSIDFCWFLRRVCVPVCVCVCVLWHLYFHYLAFRLFILPFHIHLSFSQAQMKTNLTPCINRPIFPSNSHRSMTISFDFIHIFFASVAADFKLHTHNFCFCTWIRRISASVYAETHTTWHYVDDSGDSGGGGGSSSSSGSSNIWWAHTRLNSTYLCIHVS